VGKHELFIKSSVGLQIGDTGRADSLCQFTVLGTKPYRIENGVAGNRAAFSILEKR